MAITALQMKEILDNSRSKSISVAWLQITIMATNVDGAISKYIEPEKYNDSDYPDIVQEIQTWIAKVVIAKRIIVSKQVKIKKSIIKLVKEVENHPEKLIQIFYDNRYFFEKLKKKSHKKVDFLQ